MRVRWRVYFALLGFLAILALGCAAAAFLHSDRLDAVTVRFTGPGPEAKDVAILGLGKDHVKPDYKLVIVLDGREFGCGTIWDTSAVGGIRFAVLGDVPLREARELRLVENDRVTDDELIARVPFAPPSMTAEGYVFDVESSRSFEVGLSWFLGTPIGLIILLAGALLLLYLLSALARAAVTGEPPPPPSLPDIEPPDLC